MRQGQKHIEVANNSRTLSDLRRKIISEASKK
jgi:hypothetical protein